ncbi:MAG: formylglycine-generating enzyme family protein [Alcanivoracaceae bacterium]|nr:formylglycine-generating enzyme family protein [Alcanivoracaceae bacterium]
MKNPIAIGDATQYSQIEKNIGIDLLPNEQTNTFDPSTNFPILENILDIPAWTFDLAELEALTSDELVSSIQLAIQQQRYFQPENDNALFYLINLKSLDSDNLHIIELTEAINQQLSSQTQIAIQANDEKQLISIIARTKTLSKNNSNIKELRKKLVTIKTINKLYAKGTEQIFNNLIVREDSQDAWHTAKQCLDIDFNNSKTQLLVTKVNDILIDRALRAAEETDFIFAQSQIEQAQLLDPNSFIVAQTQNKISQLRQQRYLWLEQQLAIAIDRINISRAQRMLNQLAEIGLQRSQLDDYQSELDRITTFGKYQPLQIFSHQNPTSIKLPNMVVIPTGSYVMGSRNGPKHEKPPHTVNINYGFAASQNEISVADFRLFIQNTNYKTDAEKNNTSKIYDIRTGRLKNKNRINWQKDYLGKKAKGNIPVIHVSWNDAIAYTQWLSELTGKNYRLITESEFEYILRAGSKSIYPRGDSTPLQVIENLTGKLDKSKKSSRIRWKNGFDKYNDKYWGPAPTGSFINNPFKLNDTAGNVMEWVMDCWHDSYVRAPLDGTSWTNPGCEDHVIRGGSWSSAKNEFTSSHRFRARAPFTDARLGFRVAVDLLP